MSVIVFVGCNKDDAPKVEERGEVGVFCVLDPDRAYNQQVVLKRLPLQGAPEIYTSIMGAQVKITAQGKVYEFSETYVPGTYRADFHLWSIILIASDKYNNRHN